MSLPAGTVISYVGTDASLNNLLASNEWLQCDGQSYATEDWPDLYDAIGYTFGKDQTGSKFYVPDLRGMFLRGVTGASSQDLDSDLRTPQINLDGTQNGNSGNNVGSWQLDALENHSHNWNYFFYSFSYDGNNIACHQPADSQNLQKNPRQATNVDGGEKVGSSSGVETRPKNVYVYYLIRCTAADASHAEKRR